MSVVFWKSYSTQKCIWPTFSLGSELSIYISIIDALRFCWRECRRRVCGHVTVPMEFNGNEKKKEKENDRIDQKWTDVSIDATINHILLSLVVVISTIFFSVSLLCVHDKLMNTYTKHKDNEHQTLRQHQ